MEFQSPGLLIILSSNYCTYYLQVTQGISEFKPTPSENREFFKKSYSVPHTLLVFPLMYFWFVYWWLCVGSIVNSLLFFFVKVKFNIDAIDETDMLEDILRPRVESIGGTLEKITLSGNHLTPCIQVWICSSSQIFHNLNLFIMRAHLSRNWKNSLSVPSYFLDKRT